MPIDLRSKAGLKVSNKVVSGDLRKNLAKRFIVGVKDFHFSAELQSLLKDFPIAGIALFNSPHSDSRHLWSDPQAALEALYEFVSRIRSEVQFLVADQEGGRVLRLKKPFIELPSAAKISEAFPSDSKHFLELRELYQAVAEQMSLCQIRWNFAPVCDLRQESGHSVIGDRSYSDKADEVVSQARIFCESFQDRSVLTCLKHFPGHGSSSQDSHEKIAVLGKSEEEMIQTDQKIFQELASVAGAIMPGHLAFPEKPDELLSLKHDFLKASRELFPSKLIWITDDLISMKAVSEMQPWRLCLRAGYDYILLCGEVEQAHFALEDSLKLAETEPLSIQASSFPFQGIEKLPRFSSWREKIEMQTEKAHRLLEKRGLELG